MTVRVGETSWLNPLATASAFARVAYNDLVTVIVVSVLFTLISLPLVTIGGALVGLVGALTEHVATIAAGEKMTERETARRFLAMTRANVLTGLPFSVLLVGTLGATALYGTLATSGRNIAFFLGAVIGGYAVLVAIVVTFRAASLSVRAPADNRPTSRRALRDASFHLLDASSYSVLQTVTAGILVSLCVVTKVGVVLLLPGMLGVLEVISFEERSGEGAVNLVHGYEGETP